MTHPLSGIERKYKELGDRTLQEYCEYEQKVLTSYEEIVPTNDEMPLTFIEHTKISDEWDFKVPYIGKTANRILDWFWLKVYRPKFTESNIERIIVNINK